MYLNMTFGHLRTVLGVCASDDALVVSLVLALGTDKETKNLMEDLCDQLNTVLRKGSGQNREMALFRVSRGVRRVQDRLMKHIFRNR